MEYQFTCPECSNFIINHDTEETPPKTISCPYCKKTIINENYTFGSATKMVGVWVTSATCQLLARSPPPTPS